MKVSLFDSKIEITNNLSKLLKDLENAKIKFNKIDGYVIFNAKIIKELPEFLVNVKYYGNEVYELIKDYENNFENITLYEYIQMLAEIAFIESALDDPEHISLDRRRCSRPHTRLPHSGYRRDPCGRTACRG